MLLNQSEKNGCNMVNWYLQDWWREVEDDEAIQREKKFLQSGPGIVCGLGGSPYATSYPGGLVSKLHSVHIANVGHHTVDDIVAFGEECPTRPLFMVLFAQINPGIWKQIKSEIDDYAKHLEIALLIIDEFFLTFKDAQDKGMIDDPLYEITPKIEETWLRTPGRHRLPICERLTEELIAVANADQPERGRHLAEAMWTELVSREIESVARDREQLLTGYVLRTHFTEEEGADALLYAAFTTARTVVRAAIQSQGIYANHRDQCLEDFKRTCRHLVDVAPFEVLFEAWVSWEDGVPTIEEQAALCEGIAKGARQLRATLGPDESDEDFDSWPPPSI